MTVALAFIQDIKDHPDDDVPRLIFADWLEEHGDPRGEFLRVQVQRARLRPNHPQQGALRRRELELLREHAVSWLEPWLDLVIRWEFERGLISLSARAERFLSNEAAALATAENCAWLTTLSLQELTARHVPRLVASPFLPPLVTLDLSGNRLGPQGARALAESPQVAQLRTLRLRGNRLGVEGVRSLANSPHLARLTNLDLTANLLGDAGAAVLAESPYLRHLQTLYVGRNRIHPGGHDVLRQRFGGCLRLS
jgi:uncharacterized protein (TIGR02996 family)